jgi:FtsH-binding integral membrane protein
MTWSAFLLQVLPIGALALAATAVGSGIFSEIVSPAFSLPLIVVGLILFVALLTFRNVAGWNLGLLITFALVVGLYLGRVFPEVGGSSWRLTLMVVLGLLLGAAAIGARLSGRLQRLGSVLWIVSWIYLLGWILVALLPLAPPIIMVWASVGVAIFFGLSSSWFAGLRDYAEKGKGVTLAIDLYILGINLALTARVAIFGIH